MEHILLSLIDQQNEQHRTYLQAIHWYQRGASSPAPVAHMYDEPADEYRYDNPGWGILDPDWESQLPPGPWNDPPPSLTHSGSTPTMLSGEPEEVLVSEFLNDLPAPVGDAYWQVGHPLADWEIPTRPYRYYINGQGPLPLNCPIEARPFVRAALDLRNDYYREYFNVIYWYENEGSTTSSESSASSDSEESLSESSDSDDYDDDDDGDDSSNDGGNGTANVLTLSIVPLGERHS